MHASAVFRQFSPCLRLFQSLNRHLPALRKESSCSQLRQLSSSSFCQGQLRSPARAEAVSLQTAEEDKGIVADPSNNVASRVNSQLRQGSEGRLFAVVQLCGTQRKVTAEDILVWRGNLLADVGERIRLEKVVLVGSKDFSIVGRPVLSRDLVRVEATVIEKFLEHSKVRAYYKRRKRTRKMIPYQEPLAYLRINCIELNTLAAGEEYETESSTSED